MALRHYDGINPETGNPYPNNAGNFNYDDTQFTVATDGHLYYIGNEVLGEKINIPDGITDCTRMFSETAIQTPPRIPRSVIKIDEMFRGCKSLTRYPEVPSTVTSKVDFMSDISKTDIEHDDRTLQFLSREMDEHIDSIEKLYDKEIIHIENFYNITGKPEKMDKALINADLISRLAICHKQVQGLTKMQNHLNAKAEFAKSMGAPSNYMQDSIDFKKEQIAQIKTEIANIRKELRYRNPTVLDIARATAIDYKEKLVSYGQKVQEGLIEKATALANSLKKGIGNVFRASELAALKVDLKVSERLQNISRSNIDRSQQIYCKIAPGIAAVSMKASAVKESLKTLKANLEGKTYTAIPGMTETGVKMLESMRKSLNTMINDYQSNEGRLEQLRDKVRELSQNLSPKEHSTSTEFLQNIGQKMSQITAGIRSAVQEKVATYQAMKESRERGNMSDIEQMSDPKEMYSRNPNGIRAAETVFPSPQVVDSSERRLFSEIQPVNEKPYTDEQMNAKYDSIMNSLKKDGQEKINQTIKTVDEKGTFQKPDHAETLTASAYSQFFGGAELDVKDAVPVDLDNDFMATAVGQNAVADSLEFNADKDFEEVQKDEMSM